MDFVRKLPIPQDIKKQFPIPEEVKKIKAERDAEIADILQASLISSCLSSVPALPTERTAFLITLTALQRFRIR